MVRRSSRVFLLIASLASAQSFEGLFPVGAKLIETVDVSGLAKKHRMLVLWMVNPSRHVRTAGESYCGDAIDGDYWEGPTRLSLLDPSTSRLINSTKIETDSGEGKPEDSFHVPFFVPRAYYFVPNPNSNGEGVPRILHLRDLTGEGLAAQFPMFIYQACGAGNLTAAFGYSLRADEAVQYRVGRSQWVNEIFAEQPVSPGHWKFTWGPGHGVDDLIDEEVTFDTVTQRFVAKSVVHHPK
jgi:hypothetical protein